MRAIEFLNQIEKFDVQIKNKYLEIERIKTKVTSTSISYGDRVQTSNTNSTQNAVIDYIELEKKLQNDIKKLEAKRAAIVETIEKLSTNEYEVMFQAFVLRKSRKEIAYELDKSESWVSKTKKKGLKSMEKILRGMKNV